MSSRRAKVDRGIVAVEAELDRHRVAGSGSGLDRDQRFGELRLQHRADTAHLGLPGAEHVVEEVLRVADDRRALGEKLVRKLGERRVDRARHRQHLAAEPRRLLDRVLGARAVRALDDHDEAGKRGHDPVAGGEKGGIGLRAGRLLGDDGAAGGEDPAVERLLRARVRRVGRAAKDGDRRAIRVERALVRGGVAAERHPAHDQEAGGSGAEAEIARHLAPVCARAAGADDRDRAVRVGLGEELAGAQAVEDLGLVLVHRGELGQAFGPALLPTPDSPPACGSRSAHSALLRLKASAPWMSSAETSGRPARSASVRATRRTRSCPRPERPSVWCPEVNAACASFESGTCSRSALGPSSALAQPCLSIAACRASETRSRTTADDSPGSPESASAEGCSIESEMSMRSASAPEMRLR